MKHYLKVALITLAIAWPATGFLLAVFQPEANSWVQLDAFTYVPAGNTPCHPKKYAAHDWGPWSPVLQLKWWEPETTLFWKFRTCKKCGAYYQDFFSQGKTGRP